MLLLCAFFGPAECEDIRIDVSKPAFRKIAVAVPEFRGETGHEATAADVISYDLEFSRYFLALDRGGHVRDAAEKGLDFREWRAVGAEYLVWGRVSSEGGNLVLECRLFDVNRGEEITGRRYRGEESTLRDMAHRFSDEVVRTVTGRDGIARTNILFVSDVSGQKELWLMDYDGHNPVRVTNDRSLAAVPAWIPGGRRISFTSYIENNPDFYVMDLDSGKREMILSFSGLNYSASWSPDGRRAAVTLTKSGRADIYIIDDRGNIQSRLTNSWAVDCSPHWSPCGRYIAFTSGRSGGPHIFIADLSERSLRRITSEGYNDSPRWSPDGERILFTSRRDGTFDIFTVNADGTGEQQLTSGSGHNENASYSPDGRHIVFSSNREGSREIYVMHADGSGLRRLTFLGGASEFPRWSLE